MPNHYEIILILHANLTHEEIENTLEKVKKILTVSQAKIYHEETWGIKELAYPIKKKKHGYYYLMEMELPTENIEALNTQLLQDDKLMRHLIVHLDKHGIAYNEIRREKQKEIPQEEDIQDNKPL